MGRRAARGSVAATLAWLGLSATPLRAAAGAGEEGPGALPPCDPADAPCVDRFPPALADIYTDCAGLVAELEFLRKAFLALEQCQRFSRKPEWNIQDNTERLLSNLRKFL